MSEKQTGGPAFPIPHSVVDANDPLFKIGSAGMTLRDYFAAKAMQAMVAATYTEHGEHKPNYCRWHAGHAYEMADAMLEARK
jgi:hypothetical protein